MHFGIISPPVPGHIHPFGALGRELIERGHRVTFFQMCDLAERVALEELEFVPIGQSDHPRGSLPQSLAKLGELNGLAALRFTIQQIAKTTEMFCRDAPTAIQQAEVEFLLVDQTEPEGGSIAEHLGLPFVTICNALALNREADVPPPFTSWSYQRSWWAAGRNTVGYAVSDRVMKPVTQVVKKYRKQWGLPAYRSNEDSFSPLAQISQQAAAFDFPRRRLPNSFHYVGPLRKASSRVIPFPWEKLVGHRLIYASLGTLQNGKEAVFRCFAEACQGLDVQLLVSHGGGLTAEAASSLPGSPLVVNYSPQLQVLERASLTLTHAGLNTVLDSLSQGVPLVAIPITYEQPAIAKRVAWCGAGEVLPFPELRAETLRGLIQRVLSQPTYGEKAKSIQQSIRKAGGVGRAADLIEGFVKSDG